MFLIRGLSSAQLDDVTPGIQCDRNLLTSSDVLFVIPKFENKSIADNKTWCDEILKLNKTLEMHGVYHTYNEFKIDRTSDHIQEGMDAFFQCFGYYPTEFKAPQLSINSQNKQLIKVKMKFIGYFDQLFHKTYHCSDTGQLFNNFIGKV
jgi:predicted deacetylase